MTAMIQNDEEKEWMLPLLDIRNELDLPDDRHLRDFRRMNGLVQLFHNRPIPGPYTQESREHWLRRVLEAQQLVRANGPRSVRNIELITLDELREIRRIWVVDKHELEDSLPSIYESVIGTEYPDGSLDDTQLFGRGEMELLREICCNDDLHFQLSRELLDVEHQFRAMARRAGLFDALENVISKHFFSGEEDATERALRKQEAQHAAETGQYLDIAKVEVRSTMQEPEEKSAS